MQKVLMVLTNARLDCLKLALEMLVKGGNLEAFDRVVFLMNAVKGRHREYIFDFISSHHGTAFDHVDGPGTRPDGISWMQNECIRRYPGSLYTKIDEDVFVPSGWAKRLFEVYEQFRERENLSLITPLLPNNSFGLHQLLTNFYPEALAEHKRLFNCEPSPEVHSLTWNSPVVAAWATRLFANLDAANEHHRNLLAGSKMDRCLEFCKYFSIGCITYDHRHIERMGGIPRTDEPGWCTWIESNKELMVLDRSQIVLHYSFFVQQDWLDRSSLLEDLRVANLPDTLQKGSIGYHLPRIGRISKQLPRVVPRKIKALLGRASD